ncbi:MAG: DUF1896 family protein [Prevotella sp.]|nr:DUF1896 family protein [Prevotella sp.]
MKREQQQLSYYGLYLLRYLMEQHSKKAKDLNFIYQRELLAAETFEQARREGHSVEGAQELAMDALMKGLSMTPWSILMEVLEKEFAVEVDEEQIPFAEKLLPLVKPVFEPYDLTQPEFELSTDYVQLYTELTGAVVLYIEQYGVQ